MELQTMDARPRISLLPAALAGWWTFLVVDFLLHAVFLAVWWRSTESYWLPPDELFRRIPLGYASFAIYVSVLTWLVVRLHGERPRLSRAARFGVLAGLISGTFWALATYSVFSMPRSALVVWTASFALESVGATTVVAWVLAGSRPWRRVGLVAGVGVTLLIVGVVIQNLLFPTPGSHLSG
jgi:hypothetical protein